MSKLFLILSLLLIGFGFTSAQNADYFQQEVNNKINATLDDVNHRLKGNIVIDYINNSPDTLTYIWFNIFPNAYSSIKTAFAKQKQEYGDLDFYYSTPEEKGYMDSLGFMVNGKNATLVFDKKNPDIAQLMLNEKLLPGKTAIINTNFRVQLPKTFSRGGHIGNAYQITQWFPKPAVYDLKGWHPIPYLDQGEFYSEFGSYEVNITLPENYKVAATGNLTTESEIKWLDQISHDYAYLMKIDTSDSRNKVTGYTILNGEKFPLSSSRFKTIHYSAKNVHDFAWFADKRFHVMKSSVYVPGNTKKFITWAFFLDKHEFLWQDAVKYIDSSLYYYSKWVGDYPYDNCTAVEGPLVAGDGMEYPMITIIGDINNARELETVIAHEVGHNWFQGMLGFNERDYPWMDEGINSYYERRYIAQRYPHYNELDGLNNTVKSFVGIDSMDVQYQNYLATIFQERRHDDQPTCLSAVAFSSFNYGAMIYSKVPFSFNYFQKYYGDVLFDNIMQSFFRTWQYKHPQPADLKNHFDKLSGKENDWFFNGLLCSTDKLDYKIVNAKDTVVIGEKAFGSIKIKNTGKIKAPFSISAYKGGEIVLTQWYDGFGGLNKILFPVGYAVSDIDLYKIDASGLIPEYKRNNNSLRAHGILKKIEPLHLQPIGSLENPNRTNLYFAPAVGYNLYDHASVGIAIYNSLIPVKNIEWLLIPLYSTNTNRLRGLARLNAFMYPKNKSIQSINWMTTSTFYSYDYADYRNFSGEDYFNDVFRIASSLNLKFRSKNQNATSTISLRCVHLEIQEVTPTYSDSTKITFQQWYPYNFIQLKYTYKNERKLNPFSFSILTEAQKSKVGDNSNANYIGNTEIEFNYRINYTAKKGLDIRLYSAFNFSDLYLLHLNAGSGNNDYTFDHYFIGRTETTGLAARQITNTGGNLKFSNNLSSLPIGGDNNSVSAINLKSSLPVPLFFLFADVGYYTRPIISFNNQYSLVQFDGGIGIHIIPDVCDVYLPLVASKDIRDNIFTYDEYNKWYKRILFTFELEKIDVFSKIRNIKL